MDCHSLSKPSKKEASVFRGALTTAVPVSAAVGIFVIQLITAVSRMK